MRGKTRIALFAIVLSIPVASFGLVAATVDQGYDILETAPAATFQDLTLPADFFGPGSDPFTGRVTLSGVPFDCFDPDGLGGQPQFCGLRPTDTIVRRLQDAGDLGFPETIQVEIVELKLVSAAPIPVTFNNGASTQLWELEARVRTHPGTGVVEPPQTQGTMTIRHEHPNGGTFDSFLPVLPNLTFTRTDGPGTIGPILAPNVVNLQAVGEPWCHQVAGPLGVPAGGQQLITAPGLTSNFLPGVICVDSPYIVEPPVSFSVDGGALNANRNGAPLTPAPNPAEGLRQPDARHLSPNDVYAVGTAPGARGYASEGEVFQGAGDVLGSPVNTTNVDRISAALGIGPTPGGPPFLGPFLPNPGGATPAPGTPGVAGPAGSFGGPPTNTVGVLGLVPSDNVDALSYGKDSGNVALFSVDPASTGALGTSVRRQSTGSPAGPAAAAPFPTNPMLGDPGAEAAGDIFKSVPLAPFGSYLALHYNTGVMLSAAFFSANDLSVDEFFLGLQAPAINGASLGAPEDDMDALEYAGTGERIFGVDEIDQATGIAPPDGIPERHVFFSIDSASPSNGVVLGPAVVSPDDILVTPPGGFAFAIYADGVTSIVGLLVGDDIDALALSDIGTLGSLDPGLDEALFSLHPGSPSVLVGPDGVPATGDELSAATIFYTDFATPFSVYAGPTTLGLLVADNLNALDIMPRSPDPHLPPPVPPIRPCPCKKLTTEEEMRAAHGIRISEKAIDTVFTTGDFEIDTFAFGPISVLGATGFTEVERGAPEFDPDTGVSTIATEIVSMDLVAFVQPEQIVHVRAGRNFGLPPSSGSVTPLTPGTDFPSASAFDVFVEIEIGGVLLRNSEPFRVQVEVGSIPPYGHTFVSTGPVQLLDVEDSPAGSIETASHALRCQSDADCDDGDPCTTDSCDAPSGSCTNAPDPDGDSDGICDGVDTCPDLPNPGQALLPFEQVVLPVAIDSLCWDVPADAEMLRGNLADVSSYGFDLIQPLPGSTCLVDPEPLLPGVGSYYLVRHLCEGGSWQSHLGLTTGRDTSLP